MLAADTAVIWVSLLWIQDSWCQSGSGVVKIVIVIVHTLCSAVWLAGPVLLQIQADNGRQI